MQLVPISDADSQQFQTTLNLQNCTIFVYQKSTGMFMDIYVDDNLVIGGVVCENMNRIVRDSYLGFIGDFMFQDTEGNDDPVSPGLGTRFLLYYLAPDELDGDD